MKNKFLQYVVNDKNEFLLYDKWHFNNFLLCMINDVSYVIDLYDK